ncbi:hypothetical protein RFI_20143 [Reticulomyxa filosa]|uniref:Kelch motif family protein n=1 Tax=Reticulomyxa filosa TaxID=46433 RepID=X6MUQ2_RETFI|nr:hypothetical protein RFI_20143 [Reticulomyxa filosa]|eukprot:ETO17187.1 hypothetical protein RFI_20143 [Reticulomyxa filosa]
MSNQTFETLKELPTSLFQSQCVLHKHELLICGGCQQRACYSYHTIKNEYKLICEYPSDVDLFGHCVVKLIDNNKDSNEIILLSFGGWSKHTLHTLVMKYVSVWSNISNKLNKSNELNNYNQWIPFTDNHNHPIVIGRDNDNYIGVRALIGGSNSHLLFITYQPNNICVFDLNTFQFIKHDKLPTNFIQFHCFVSNSENGQAQEMMKTNKQKKKQNYQMLLFCFDAGLSIEYDEDNKTFQFYQLHVCDNMERFYAYAHVCVNDIILFFSGWNGADAVSKSVHEYSIREKKWKTFQYSLPNPLFDCTAILNEEDNRIHIIGGKDDKGITLSTHMRTRVREWDPSLFVMIYLFLFILIYFNEIQINCIA